MKSRTVYVYCLSDVTVAENPFGSLLSLSPETLCKMADTVLLLLLVCVQTIQPSLGAGEDAYQQFIGCEFNSQGQTGHFWRYGYNGRNIMHMDLQRKAMVPTSEAGHFLAKQRESVQYIKLKEERSNKLCSAVQTVFSLSNSSLSRTVKPSVHVQIGKEAGQEFLMCLVYGFYPNVIRVRWNRNGKPIYYGTSTTGILPHKDGMFQITSYLSLGNNSIQGITCEVEHISIDGKLKATLDVNPIHFLLSVAAGLIGFVCPVGVTKLIIHLRKKTMLKPLNTTNNSSVTSETPQSLSLMHLPT